MGVGRVWTAGQRRSGWRGEGRDGWMEERQARKRGTVIDKRGNGGNKQMERMRDRRGTTWMSGLVDRWMDEVGDRPGMNETDGWTAQA